jgi:hypothetical protein
MLDNPELPISYEASVERLCELGIRKHEEFDRDIWKEESFHNAEHVKLNTKSALNLIDAAIQDPKNDIFKLKDQLAAWNEKMGYSEDQQLTLSNLKEIVELAFAFHDLGNIGWWTDHGFDFFEIYRSGKYKGTQGAEKRSRKTAKMLMEKHGVRENYQVLVQHLIEQTKMGWEESEPPLFGRLIRSCDQLSTNLQSNSAARFKAIMGLALEVLEEVSDTGFIPSLMIDFAHHRAPELLPQGVSLEKFAQLAGFDGVPGKLAVDMNGPISAKELASYLRSIS